LKGGMPRLPPSLTYLLASLNQFSGKFALPFPTTLNGKWYFEFVQLVNEKLLLIEYIFIQTVIFMLSLVLKNLAWWADFCFSTAPFF
jgi:hypothetical protein